MKIYRNVTDLEEMGQFDDIEICGDENNNFYPVFIKNTCKVVYRYTPKEIVPFISAINMLDENFFKNINDNYKKFSYACSLMAENSKEDHLRQHEFLEYCKKILLRRQIETICKDKKKKKV